MQVLEDEANPPEREAHHNQSPQVDFTEIAIAFANASSPSSVHPHVTWIWSGDAMDQIERMRTGYDPEFLTGGAEGSEQTEAGRTSPSLQPDAPDTPNVTETAADLPVPTREGLTVLDYVHFSVHQDIDRRMAAITAVNIDGARLREVGRSDNWALDPRLPAKHQAGEELYARNDLDRGHLVRRRDPVWGEDRAARQANRDTFHYTVCAPQAGYFNQSSELWLGVEDHVLQHARAAGQRLNVYTGCVFDLEDPEYRGFQVPRRFFKVVAWNALPDDGHQGRLASTAYLLDQGEGLDRIIRRGLRPEDEVPGPGPFKTFQVPVADVAELTGLTDEAMDRLVAADRYRVPDSAQDEQERGIRAERRWRELTHADQISL